MAATSERIADYELITEVGRGLGGNVLVARAPRRLDLEAEVVVVKVLDGTHARDRFLQAAERLERFAALTAVPPDSPYGARAAESPNVVEIYEAGRQQGAVWFSMAYHPGGSLVVPATPLSRRDRVAAVAAAARGAHALHEAGLSHGNIKPTNILLGRGSPGPGPPEAADPTGGARTAKLADIDLRDCLTPGLTLYATPLLADVELTDPDVLRGSVTSPASDVWSLGMTLHRVLAGQPVYPIGPDDDMVSTIHLISSLRYQLAPSLTEHEREVVQSCLADPADRRPTAASLAAALEDLP